MIYFFYIYKELLSYAQTFGGDFGEINKTLILIAFVLIRNDVIPPPLKKV